MTIAATIGFIVVCFLFFAILMRILGLVWGAVVYGEDKIFYDGRDYWDDDKNLEEITADTLDDMGSHSTPIEIYDPALRWES